MKQGIMTNKRVRLLLRKGDSGFHPVKSGERRRKSVHGCIVDGSLSVLNVIIVKKGQTDIPGLTDVVIPRRLGPKRAGKIRKMFNLSKEDDVRKYVLRRTVKYRDPEKQAQVTKPKLVSPKIQRLVTPITLQRRRRQKLAIKKRRLKSIREAKEYRKVVEDYNRQKRHTMVAV
ncbi:40S ribosomal protein S6 [Thelohanellus kitauei]|uniref:Small ribosomal subunit protein eS6 n=1 Tax=Thelohanellus kitauei TaxID=669202 RepID=A0A0C2IWH1_THEKT|nr:40S ribosomal protein S6 [Thelohanellus kitauei]